MTKEDIINLAHKAGFLIDTHAQQYQPNCILSTYGLIDENLQRFATLVAEHEREACEMAGRKESVMTKEIYQCPSCGGICKKSGCERANTTSPAAQRPWQGLTPEEIKHLYPYGRSVWGKETYEAIEKALKELNNG